MLKATISFLSVLFVSFAANAGAIRVTVSLPDGSKAIVDGYQSSTGQLLPISGNRDLTFVDKNGKVVDTKLAMIGNPVLEAGSAANPDAAYFVVHSESLNELGGIAKFAEVFSQELRTKIRVTMTNEKTDDFVIVKILMALDKNQNPKVDVEFALSGKMEVSPR